MPGEPDAAIVMGGIGLWRHTIEERRQGAAVLRHDLDAGARLAFAVGPDGAHAILDQLARLLAADDTAASDLFDTHRALLVASCGPQAATLGRQMADYDYPAALVTVRALAARNGE